MPVNDVAKIVVVITAIESVLFPQDIAVKIIALTLLGFTMYVALFRDC